MVNFTRSDIFEFVDIHFDYDKLTVTEDGNQYTLSAKFNVNDSGSHYSTLEVICTEFKMGEEWLSRLESFTLDISQALGEPAKDEIETIRSELVDFVDTDIGDILVQKVETPLKTMYQFVPNYDAGIKAACNFLTNEVKLPYRIDRYDSSVVVCEDVPDIEFNFRVRDQFYGDNPMTICVVREVVDGVNTFVIRRAVFADTSVGEIDKLCEIVGEFLSPSTFKGALTAEVEKDGDPYIVLS